MRFFNKRTNTADDDATTIRDGRGTHTIATDERARYAADDGRTYTTTTAPDATDDGRRWHHGPTRALTTLLAAGVAGLLAWVTTNISDKSTGGYWAVYGILAGAGLVMALSQVIGGWTKWGRPSFSPTVFLLAFVPTLIAAGWILLFHQPHATLFRGDITNWSGDLGITGLVKDLGGGLLTMLAFGLGLVLGFCFDTTGARRLATSPAAASWRTAPPDTDADQPIARERETVRS
jgi:hypothetical protein